MQPSNHAIERSFERAARWLAWSAAAIGACAFIGVLVGFAPATHFGVRTGTMKANTSLAVLLLATGVLLLGGSPRGRLVGRLAGLVVAVLGGATLLQDALGIDLGIDQIVMRQSATGDGGPGRMAPTTATELVLLGCALALTDRRVGSRHTSAWLATAALVLSLLPLAGFAFDERALYHVRGFSTKSLPAALATFLLALATVALRPRLGFAAVLSSDSLSGASVRRVLTAVFLVPFVIAWFQLEGERRGLYGTAFGGAILSLGSATTLAAVVLWSGRRMLRAERTTEALRHEVEQREAAQLAEHRRRAFVDGAAVAILEFDAAGQCRYANDAWFALAGAPTDGDALSMLAPDQRMRLVAGVAGDVVGRRAAFDLLHDAGSGGRRVLEVTLCAARDASPAASRAVVVIDVTERREAATRMANTLENLHEVVERAPVGVVVHRDGRVLYANRALAGMVSNPTGEVLEGSNVIDMFDEHDRGLARDALLVPDLGAAVEPLAMRPSIGAQPIHVKGTTTTIRYDGASALASVLIDITARVRSEQARRMVAERLAASEAKFRSLVEQSPVAMCVHRQGKLVYMNPALARILAVDPQALVGRSLVETLVHPDDRAYCTEALSRTEETREPFRGPLRCVRADGTEVVFDAHASDADFDGSRARLVVLTDITERERNLAAKVAAERELRRLLADKEMLLKEVHHRVKNNLQVIASLISLQASRTEHPAVKVELDEARRRVRTIASIHERMYRGVAFDRMNVREYLAGLVAEIERSLRSPECAVELRTSVDDVALPLNTMVPLALLLNEVLTNALKHAFVGRARGLVEVVLRDGDGEVELVVADDGVGSWQAEGATLGLTLIRGLGEQLGGRVVYDCRMGTVCKLRFPRGAAPEESIV